MKKFWLVFSLLCFIAGSVAAENARVVLARGGKAQARIIDPQSRHPVVQQAVSDLKVYLERVTGADFSQADGPAKICILDTLPSDSPKALRESKEGYWIDVRGETIRIVGASPLGTAYGVYHFLEKYAGVRWFLPAQDGEYVPSKPDLSVPVCSEFSKPAFEVRWVGAGPRDYDPSLWGLRNRSNNTGIGEEIGKDGKTIKSGYRFLPGIYHTQEDFLPSSKYFPVHPEYFVLRDGVRQDWGRAGKLCLSNAEMAAEVAKNMGKYLDEHPEVDMVNLSPTDGREWLPCQCTDCQTIAEKDTAPDQVNSRQSVIFYNRVITELRKTHPDVKVVVGAYASYTWPPKDKSLRLPPNTYVILCHYTPACLAHPVDDPDCPANRDFNNILCDWLQRSSGVYVYEYYSKHNWLGLPWPIVHTIATDIPYFHRIGVRGVYTQANSTNAYVTGLNYYIAAKLLWNPKVNVRALVDEYYRDYFAETAIPMREYFSLLERRMNSVSADIPGDAFPNGKKVFDMPFIELLQKKLDRAMVLARSETIRERVRRHQKHLEYTRRVTEALDVEAGPDKKAADAMWTAIQDDYKKDPKYWEGIVSQQDGVNYIRFGLMEARGLRK